MLLMLELNRLLFPQRELFRIELSYKIEISIQLCFEGLRVS